ncbi:hypothetical protein [Allorhodopirellula solitaria]|uniref:Chromosome partition protein Smc n=1 Tax=Allorhodopirellula solitaria TaxID=2527987 RepID=A0A5C5YK82_9BACT|nr:hypothetical protein [Allorhodopirellula solitaria]TWT75261.1 hypothetical protein CA85_05500 [Allorhodopirellula solitaria]
MPISGPQAHHQLIAAYNQAAAKLEQLRGQMGEIEKQRYQLEDDREDTLRKLAEHYLPDLTPESVQKTWAEIRPPMREILLRKEGRIRELQTQLANENEFREKLEAGLQDINERLDAAENRQEELSAQVETFLAEQPEFVDLSTSAGMAEVALQRAQDNLDEVSQDAARKLPAFDEDSLFVYLKERQFGTPAYTHRGFTRRMDRFVAKLVDYTQAKHDYDYLTNTPTAMQKIIAEDSAALETVMNEVQSERDRAANKFGLIDQIAAVESLVVERKAAVDHLGTQSAECESIQSALTEVESPRCEFYREAIDLFRQVLAGKQSSELRQEARQTPELTDDQIVASLRGIENQMDHSEQSCQRHQEDLEQGTEVYRALGRLIQRFRASGFDRQRSQFSDRFDLSAALGQVSRTSDVDALWDSLRRAQNWGHTSRGHVTGVATSPMTQILVNAMAHAAAGAMSEHARRAGQRNSRRRR